MNRSMIDLWVGVFVAAGFGGLLFLALKVGNLASFSTAKTYKAIVSLDLDSAYQFPRDTSAKILTSGILGEQYIGLEAGGDGVMLKQGDRLRLTQDAVVLENLISQFLFSKAAETKEPAKEPAK